MFYPQCVADVHEAFAAVGAALVAGNASQVAMDFNCCQIPRDPDDQVTGLCLLNALGEKEIVIRLDKDLSCDCRTIFGIRQCSEHWLVAG